MDLRIEDFTIYGDLINDHVGAGGRAGAKNLLPVSLTPANNLCHGFSVNAGVVDTGEQFITGDNDTGNNFVAGDNNTGDNFVAVDNDTGEQLSPVTTTPAINLLPVTRIRTPWRCQG